MTSSQQNIDPVTGMEVKKDPPVKPIEAPKQDSSTDYAVLPDDKVFRKSLENVNKDLDPSLSEFSDFVDPSIGSYDFSKVDEMQKVIGQNMPNLTIAGRSLAKFGVSTAETFIGGMGYTFDLENHLTGGGSPSNWLSDSLEGWSEKVHEDYKTYRTSDKTMAFGELAWWGEGVAQLGTTAGMMMDMLVFRGVGTALKAGARGYNIYKAADAYRKGQELRTAAYAMKAHNLTRVGMGENIAYAVLARAGESAMEADDSYRSLKKEMIDSGISAEVAEELAKKAASEVYRENWWMLGQDILQQKLFSKLMGFQGKAATKTMEAATAKGFMGQVQKYMTSGYGIGKDMIGEGLEEAYQYIVQEDARQKALVHAGLKIGPTSKSLTEYAGDMEMWNAAFWGAAGAGVMQGMSRASRVVMNKIKAVENDTKLTPEAKQEALANLYNELESKQERVNRTIKTQAAYHAITTASAKGDMATAEALMEDLFVDSAISSVMRNKDAEEAFLLEEFAKDPSGALLNHEDGQIEISEEQKEVLKGKVDKMQGIYTKTQEAYKANLKKYESPKIAEVITKAQLSKELATNRATLSTEAINEGKKQITEANPGRKSAVEELHDVQFRRKAAKETARQVATVLEENEDLDEEQVNNLKEIQKEAEQEYEKTSNELAEWEQSRSPEDYVNSKENPFGAILNSAEGEALLKKMVQDKFTQAQLKKATQELAKINIKDIEKTLAQYKKLKEEIAKEKASTATTTAEGEAFNAHEKNPASESQENAEEEFNFQEEEEEFSEENYDDAHNDFQESERNYEEESRLKHINGVAWVSSNMELSSPEYTRSNNRTAEDIANEKVLAALFENPGTDLSKYEVEYSIDLDYLNKQAASGTNKLAVAQKAAIENGTEVPLIGLLPVKMIIKDKATGPLLNSLGTPVTVWVHNAHNVKEIGEFIGVPGHIAAKQNHHYSEEVRATAVATIPVFKNSILENYKSGQPNLLGSLEKQNDGHIIVGEAQPVSAVLTSGAENYSFAIGNSSSASLVASNGKRVKSKIKNPKSGVLYVQGPSGWFPVKVPRITAEEAEVVVEAYMEWMKAQQDAGKLVPNAKPSKELLEKLNLAGNFDYLGSEPLLKDIINTLVYQGAGTFKVGTKNDRALLMYENKKDKAPTVRFGTGGFFNLEELTNNAEKKAELIKLIQDNKLRNIERSRLSDPKYKKAIFPGLQTVLGVTPEGNFFVQPTITHTKIDPDAKKAEKESNAKNKENVDPTISSLETDIREEKARILRGEGNLETLAATEKALADYKAAMEAKNKETTTVSTQPTFTTQSDVDTKKADIEKRRQELQTIKGILRVDLGGFSIDNVSEKFYNNLIHATADSFYKDLKNWINEFKKTQKPFTVIDSSEIIAKYDAELKALEETQAEEFTIEAFPAEETEALSTEELINQEVEAIEVPSDEDLRTFFVGKTITIKGFTGVLTKINEHRYEVENEDSIMDVLTEELTQDVLSQEYLDLKTEEITDRITKEQLAKQKEVEESEARSAVKNEVSKYEVNFISEGEIIVNGVNYVINTNLNGNITSLSPTNNPRQKITNEQMIIATEIERGRHDFISKTDEEVAKTLESLEKESIDVAKVVNTIWGYNLNEAVTSGLNKLYDNKELNNSEALAVSLWLTDVFDKISLQFNHVKTKDGRDALIQAYNTAEIINGLLYKTNDIKLNTDEKPVKPATNTQQVKRAIIAKKPQKEVKQEVNKVEEQKQQSAPKAVKEETGSSKKEKLKLIANANKGKAVSVKYDKYDKPFNATITGDVVEASPPTELRYDDGRVEFKDDGVYRLQIKTSTGKLLTADISEITGLEEIKAEEIKPAQPVTDETTLSLESLKTQRNGLAKLLSIMPNAERQRKLAEIDAQIAEMESSMPVVEKTPPAFTKESWWINLKNKLQDLYPQINLSIVENPQFQVGNDVLNQQIYNNAVAFRLKAVDILLSDKAEQVFEKGNKNKWSLDKMLSELQVPKEQKQLILDLGKTNREEIITDLLANYSYTVEINTAKAKSGGLDFYEGFTLENNTQYYSNLTVPGGTNYTEQEIATPAITPSIKGHAQFATDKGIGWFRSDDKVDGSSLGLTSAQLANMPEEDIAKFTNATKTRRILEVQSDLFQKGRDKEDLVGGTQDNKNEYDDEQKIYIVDGIRYVGDIYANRYQKFIPGYSGQLISKEEFEKNLPKKEDTSENQFLQLLNKNNNWITFFVKSIIQDSAKKGYEKVLFPTGDTASKVEGHTTLEEFKKQKEDRIKELEEKKKKNTANINDFLSMDEQVELLGADFSKELPKNYIENKINNEITQLKQELERVEGPEGFGALKPIYNFYENVVANILKKQGLNPVLITDEYGNTWNEVAVEQTRDLANVLLQKGEGGNIVGQANIKALTVLVDAINQKADTLPHEYAHHYIRMFANTPIVKAAISKWGSEEALVQAIGEQVVTQKGEALNWWNKFIKWILGRANGVTKLDAEMLKNILTDAFLNAEDLNQIDTLSKTPITPQPVKATPTEVNNTLNDSADISVEESNEGITDETVDVKESKEVEAPVVKEDTKSRGRGLKKIGNSNIKEASSSLNNKDISNKNTTFDVVNPSLKEKGKDIQDKCK